MGVTRTVETLGAEVGFAGRDVIATVHFAYGVANPYVGGRVGLSKNVITFAELPEAVFALIIPGGVRHQATIHLASFEAGRLSKMSFRPKKNTVECTGASA